VARLQWQVALKLKALQSHATPNNVHQARSAARRVRAILTVFKQDLPKELSRDYVPALKRVTRKLGQIRDIDVAQRSIDRLSPVSQEGHGDAIKALKLALNTRRARMVFAMQSEWLTSLGGQRLITRLRAEGLRATPMNVTGAVRLSRRRKRLRARLLKCKSGSEALHRLRRKVKILRYASEELQVRGTARIREEELAGLAGLQEVLGRLQDFQSLREVLRRHGRYRRTIKALRARAAIRRRRLLRDFMERRSALLRVWENEAAS